MKGKKKERFRFSPRFHSEKVRNSPYSRVQWATELQLNFGRKSVCSRQRPAPPPSAPILFLTRLALRFLSHPSVTTASIMWEIVSGAGCWNRTMCARLSMSATCPRRGRRMYPPRRMSKHFSDTRASVFFRARFASSTGECREGTRGWVTLKYHRVVETSFGKSLKRLTLGKSSEFEHGKIEDFENKG